MTHSEKNGNVEIIEVRSGKLDADTAPAFREAMEARCRSARKVVLDLKQVTFVDSSGLGAILASLQQLRRRGGDLRLCNLAARVRTLVKLVRLDQVIAIHGDRDQAVAAFS